MYHALAIPEGGRGNDAHIFLKLMSFIYFNIINEKES